MKHVFPAIFRPQSDATGFHVFFPDISGAGTVGEDLSDCLEMGEDWLCSRLYEMEKENETIPAPSHIDDVKRQTGDIVTLIATDTNYYRRFYENKAIKKTLTLPAWLNDKAEKSGLNFSQTLQKAIKEELQITE